MIQMKKFIAAKQWKKVVETSSKLSMAITAKKRAPDKLEDFQSKRKKLASKKSYHIYFFEKIF